MRLVMSWVSRVLKIAQMNLPDLQVTQLGVERGGLTASRFWGGEFSESRDPQVQLR